MFDPFTKNGECEMLKIGTRVRLTSNGRDGTITGYWEGHYQEVPYPYYVTYDGETRPRSIYGTDEFVVLAPAGLAPQTKKVLDLLRSKQSLTGVEAAAVLKVRSLSKRICEIKAAGIGIHTEYRRDTTGQRYARYYLVEDATRAAA